MNIEKMRQDFYAWHKKETAAFMAAGEIQAAHHMRDFKETMLAVWEASRAALVIELPSEEPGYMYYAPDVVEAIEAAGVGVKS